MTTSGGLESSGSSKPGASKKEEVEFLDLQPYVKKASISLFVLSVSAFLFSLYFYRREFSGVFSSEQEVWGQFGDFLGGTLNPFFGFLSLTALLATLIIQTRELKISTNAIVSQSAHFEMQAFENTFYSMISMISDNAKALDLGDSEPESFVGLRAFRKVSQKLKPIYKAVSAASTSTDGEFIIRESYDRFYTANVNYIGHYMRALNQLFVFVDSRGPNNNLVYWEIIRGHLSSPELFVIFYHSLCRDDFFDHKKLIDRNIFLHLSRDELLDADIHGSYLL